MIQSTLGLTDSSGERAPEMACSEQPQERMERFGVGAMSDTELLAMILQGSGTRIPQAVMMASRLIAEAGSIAGLISWVASDYRQMKGIGRTKGLQLAALAEIARRMMTSSREAAPLLNRADLIAAHFAPIVAGLQIEKFWVLCLNRKNRLLKQVEVTSGTATAALAHPREVYREAIRQAAAAIVCVHNLCAAAHRLCYVARRAMWSDRVIPPPVATEIPRHLLHITRGWFFYRILYFANSAKTGRSEMIWGPCCDRYWMFLVKLS
jgi:DNA repair protein RadC